MRGLGQIAELCAIAEPDIAAITNVGPVHLELLGTFEAIAEAKAEILAGLADGGRAVVPADAEALEPHLVDGSRRSRSAPAATCSRRADVDGGLDSAVIATPARRARGSSFPFTRRHNLANTTCAVAVGVALGMPSRRWPVGARAYPSPGLRGEMIELPGGSVAGQRLLQRQPALDARGARAPRGDRGDGRRIAVLGGMAELGPDGPAITARRAPRPAARDRRARRGRRAGARLRTRPTGPPMPRPRCPSSRA